MSDGYELLRAFRQAPASQLSEPVLGYYIVDVIFAGSAYSPCRERRSDFAYSTVLCRGRESYEALSSFGLAGTSDLIYLPAGAGHLFCSDRFGTDLSPEIHFYGCIYGDHIVVFADDIRVVYIVNRQYLY